MDAALWPPLPRNWKKLEILGEGTTSTVIEVAKSNSAQSYALKIFKEESDMIASEREILVLLGSPTLYTVAFLGSYTTSYQREQRKCLLFAKMNITFRDWCINYHTAHFHAPDVNQLHSIVRSGLLGLQFIHNKGVVHRDLKPGNFFLTGPAEKPVLMFADFGFSCIPAKAGTCDRFFGTLGYMPREAAYNILKRIPFTEEELVDADLFALGASFYFAIFTMSPYEWIMKKYYDDNDKKTETFQAIFAEYIGVARPFYSCPKLESIISNLIEPEAAARKTITQLLAELKA